jgi:hypothetical protein
MLKLGLEYLSLKSKSALPKCSMRDTRGCIKSLSSWIINLGYDNDAWPGCKIVV